ncbi:MAG: TlpA family protein disulfide reductase [Thermoleophilaceae bacterium]|nr:TlpA family protein disulfide reductase [Thermoleophilaceae bacterium]
MNSEDRFGDLGGPKKSAAERFEELDEREPEKPEKKSSGPARPSSVYSWVVGVVFLIVAILVALNTIPDSGESLRGPDKGRPTPVFAAPSAFGTLDGDANLKQRAGDGSAANTTPACDVDEPGVVNLCDYRGKKPIVLTMTFLTAADCEPQLDRVERVRREFPEVAFVGVVSGEKRERVAALARKRRWGFPIAVDPDGGVTNLFRIGGCPTTVIVGKDGRVQQTDLGELSEAQLRATAERLSG